MKKKSSSKKQLNQVQPKFSDVEVKVMICMKSKKKRKVLKIRKLLCKLGFHKWKEYNQGNTMIRKCIYCGKKQKLLPGYGGNEICHWYDIK